MSFKVRDALSGFGWLVAAGAFLIGNVTGDAVHPLEQVASSPAAFNPCPEGWLYTETLEHGRLLSCSKDGWVVVLDAEYQFEYGINTLSPIAVETDNPAEVPEWR